MQALRGIGRVRDKAVGLPRHLIQRLKLTRHLMNTFPLTQRGRGDLIQQTALCSHQPRHLLQVIFQTVNGP